MLAAMLDKLGDLYPGFSDTVYWEKAHTLLAEFCVPQELRNTAKGYLPDTYYISIVADQLGIEYMDVYEAFYEYSYDNRLTDLHTPESKEPIA